MTQELRAPSFVSSLLFQSHPSNRILAMTYLGAISDEIDCRKVFLVCLAAYPIRFLLTSFFSSPVIIMRLLHGLTFGGLYIVSTAYLSEVMKEEEGFALSLYTIFMNMGNLVGNYLLASILSFSNFRIMYLAAAFISGLSIPIFLILERTSQ